MVRRVHSNRARLRSEVARMSVATQIGASTALFTVPPVLAVDEGALAVTVGFVDSFVPLGSLPLPREGAGPLFLKLGSAIRAIHDGVYVDEQGVRQPLFHGDMDPYNVGVDGDGQLVFLDWDAAPGLEGLDVTAQEADLGLIQFYLATLFVRRLRPRSVAEDSLRRVVRGYCEPAGGMQPGEVQSLGLRVGQALTRRERVPGRGPRRALRLAVRWGALRLLDSFDPW